MILIVGDLHGHFEVLNELIAEQQPDIILQVGDFGYWPKEYPGWPPDDAEFKLGQTTVYWCDGNHEDHEALELIRQTGQFEVAPNCFYQPRGSTLTLPDGRRVLFFGGADSIDKIHRHRGRDWFSQELPTYSDFYKVPTEPVDIVISHTAPAYFNIEKCPPFGYAELPWLAKFDESTPRMLDAVLELVQPTQWFFGHYHIHQVGHDCGVDWTALGYVDGMEKWWIEL